MEKNEQPTKSLEMVLSVGEIYPEWCVKQDGYILEYGENGFVLYAMLNGISPVEREQFNPGAEFAIRYEIINDVCLFCFRFGNMPWADCPFSPALYKAAGQNIELPQIEGSEGFPLTVLLIDTSSGELCGIRLIGLGHELSRNWREWAQEAIKKDLSRDEYNSQIDGIYRDFSTVDLAERGAETEFAIFPKKQSDKERELERL
ncbi:hypothetical protein OBV_p-00550 (plasmid) [Oscillibacter valericigenes Sjm18-20]|nr:hypothetical protein OBV_p-00550 [Oscillibacter valericigenes Sjm18-20]